MPDPTAHVFGQCPGRLVSAGTDVGTRLGTGQAGMGAHRGWEVGLERTGLGHGVCWLPERSPCMALRPWVSGKLGQKGITGTGGDLSLDCTVDDLQPGPAGH